MRLFQQQAVYNAMDNTTSVPPPPPPFLPANQEEERRMSLLRESTTHLREGRQRLPTPDRVAIMDLSSSFQKRRLGKQQQILSEITQRCREQEVTDLSSKISAKVDLKKSVDNGRDSPLYPARMPHMRHKGPFSHGSLSSGDLRELENIEKRVKSEKGYKFFPARKIMRRQPSRLQLIQTSTIKVGGPGSTAGSGGGGGLGGSTYREMGTTGTTGSRAHIDFLKGMRSVDPDHRAQVLERQSINGSIQLQHYIQPKLDAMAPLLLPDLTGMDGGYQDRIDSYFSSSRLALNQRSRSFFDTSSVSGRSFRSLYTGTRPTGSRHQLQSMRSERAPGGLQQIQDDVSVGRGAGRMGTAGMSSGEMHMDLKSSASVVRSESQKV